jgi:outer membrane scaffolding protein for murein synthesis (MipA/OmpV family)
MKLKVILLNCLFVVFLLPKAHAEWGLGYGALLVPHYYGSGEYYYLQGPFPLFGNLQNQDKNTTSDKTFYFEGASDFRLAVNPDNLLSGEPANYNDSNSIITGYRSYNRRGMEHVPASLFLGVKIGAKFLNESFIEYSITPGVHLGSGWGNAGVIYKVKAQFQLIKTNEQNLYLEFDAINTNDHYNDNYYSVKATEVTTGRALFNASLSGRLVNLAGVFYRLRAGQVLILAGIEVQDMKSSVVKDSPLVRSETGYFGGAAIGIYF